jgi:hypothetical protein
MMKEMVDFSTWRWLLLLMTMISLEAAGQNADRGGSLFQADSVGGFNRSIGVGIAGGYTALSPNVPWLDANGVFNGSFNVNGTYSLGKRRLFSIMLDLGYMNRGWSVNMNTTDLMTPVEGDTTLVNKFKWTYQRHHVYLNTAFGVVLKKLNNRFFLFNSVGARVNYCFMLTSSTRGWTDAEGNNIDITNRNEGAAHTTPTWTASVIYMLGISYKVTPKFEIMASPYIEYMLTPVFGEPYRMVHVGLDVRFNLLFSKKK